MLDCLMGLKIIVDNCMADWKQVKFPRSKKKRIRKKWAKNRKNYRWVAWTTVYRIGNVIVMHPIMLAKLKKELDKRNENQSLLYM